MVFVEILTQETQAQQPVWQESAISYAASFYSLRYTWKRFLESEQLDPCDPRYLQALYWQAEEQRREMNWEKVDLSSLGNVPQLHEYINEALRSGDSSLLLDIRFMRPLDVQALYEEIFDHVDHAHKGLPDFVVKLDLQGHFQ